MKLSYDFFTAATILAVFILGYVLGSFTHPSFVVLPEIPPIISGKEEACTLDAKLCPDGSAVGRSLPGCKFPACPGESE